MRISVESSAMVKPIAETPRGSLWLSNLDLLMPANYHTHLVYFYRFNGAANFFDPTVLKAALSQTLVEFYPCAGRLKRGDNNRIEISCSGEGVLFVEAEADGEMDQLGEFAPVAQLRLTPEVDYSKGISTFPLLLLQITRFKCGGVCFGYVIEHHLADGPSAFHFLKTWSDIARGTRTTIPPFFDRWVLSARSPPQPKFSHIEYHPPPPLKTPLDTSETTFSMFKLTPDHVNALKARCKKDDDDQGISYSTYEVVAGHIWQCVCKARGLAQDQETKLYIVVAGRPRLQPPLPQGYFGNAIFSATPIATCGELESRLLDFAVCKIREAVARVDDEYMRSAIDYLEVQGDVSALARGSYTNKCPNLAIVSWIGLPLYDDVDFGWGKHVYMGPGYAPYEGKSYLLPSPENDGTLLYAVTLLKQHMKVFEKLLYQGTRHAKL